MKNLKLKFVMFAVILAGIFTAFAFSPAKADNSTVQALHWFDADTGEYLGAKTQAEQQAEERCTPPGDNVCANGYTQINDEEQPIGSPVSETYRQ